MRHTRQAVTYVALVGLLSVLGAAPSADARRAKKKVKTKAPKVVKVKPPPLGPVYKVPVDLKRDAYKGNPEALVTWVVFCDLQGSYCSTFRGSIGKAREYFGADLRVIFKHWPLNFHKDAYRSSEAALCALEQDMFWELQDWLLDHRQGREQKPQRMLAHARSVGIVGKPLAQFEACFVSRRYFGQVAEDLALGKKVGVQGIPRSYINGRMLIGSQGYVPVRGLIERELRAAKRLAKKKKLADKDVYDHIIAKGQLYSHRVEKQHKLPIKGVAVIGDPKKAKFVVTAFLDLQQGISNGLVGRLIALQKAHPSQVALVGHHRPARRARALHEAAACAQAQGKFWAFVKAADLNNRLVRQGTPKAWRQLARIAGVGSLEGFDLCVTGAGASALIQKGQLLGGRVRAYSGYMYINGRRWRGLSSQLEGELFGPKKKAPSPSADGALSRAKKDCESNLKRCGAYARMLKVRGPEAGTRFALVAKAYARACEGGAALACLELAQIYREGNGVPFDQARVKSLRSRACKLSDGRFGCPPKPKVKPKPKVRPKLKATPQPKVAPSLKK